MKSSPEIRTALYLLFVGKFTALLGLQDDPGQGTEGSKEQNDQYHKQGDPWEPLFFWCFLYPGIGLAAQDAFIGDGIFVPDTLVPDVGIHIQLFAALTDLPVLRIIGVPLGERFVVVFNELCDNVTADSTGLGGIFRGFGAWGMFLQL